MNILPPLPPYEGLHPLVVHFPIGLLAVAPLFIVLAMAWKSQARAMLLTACILVLLGTAAAFLAFSTGEAAEGLAERVPGAGEALERHEHLGEDTRNMFFVNSFVILAATGALWIWHAKIKTGLRVGAGVVLLALYAYPAVLLMNAGHTGGRLVHEFGVRAPQTEAALRAAEAAAPAPKQSEKNDD